MVIMASDVSDKLNYSTSGARGFHKFGTKRRLGAKGKWQRGPTRTEI